MKTRLFTLLACLALLSGGFASAQSTSSDGSFQVASPRLDARSPAWLLGNQFSSAIVLNYAGHDGPEAGQMFEEARVLAAKIGVSLPSLPARDGDLRSSVAYLSEVGETLRVAMERTNGTEAAASFELATLPGLAMLRYESLVQDRELSAKFALYVRLQGILSGMPEHVWSGLSSKIEDRAPLDELGAAVKRFREDSVAYLTGRG